MEQANHFFIKAILFLVFSLTWTCAICQVITKGKVEYERIENAYAFYDKLFPDETDIRMKTVINNYKNESKPKFIKTYFSMTFDENQSLYKPHDKNDYGILEDYASKNVVKRDIKSNSITSTKNILGIDYFLKYPPHKVIWRLTGESRDICGYNCRRVNGLLNDSIYLVAFYTDEITAKIGPESFGGLPGLILGIIAPEYNTSWFAKEVLININDPIDNVSIENKKELIEYDALFKKINNSAQVKVYPAFFDYLKSRSLY